MFRLHVCKAAYLSARILPFADSAFRFFHSFRGSFFGCSLSTAAVFPACHIPGIARLFLLCSRLPSFLALPLLPKAHHSRAHIRSNQPFMPFLFKPPALFLALRACVLACPVPFGAVVTRLFLAKTHILTSPILSAPALPDARPFLPSSFA